MAASEVVLPSPPREPHRLKEPATELKYTPGVSAQRSPSAKATTTATQRELWEWENDSALTVQVQDPDTSHSGEECTARCEEDVIISVQEYSIGVASPVSERCRETAQSRLLDVYGGVGRATSSTQFIDVDLSENGQVAARGKENVVWGEDQTSNRNGKIKAFSGLQSLEGAEIKKSSIWKSIVGYIKPPSPGRKPHIWEKPYHPTHSSPIQSGPGGKIQLHPSKAIPYKKRGPLLPKCTLTSLLPLKSPEHTDKMTLVLDLDETLVHSSFKPVKRPDYVIPVEINGQMTAVHVVKRPHVDQFLISMSAHFEIVVFTASLPRYADPLLDLLDEQGTVTHRLFRDACQPWGNNYVKDLRVLGRDLSRTIILDNSPASYAWHPENAVPVSSFIDDVADQELLDLIPILRSLKEAEDVRVWLDQP